MLKKIWSDPVWSKVIAAAILAIAAGLWAIRGLIAGVLFSIFEWLSKTAMHSNAEVIGVFVIGTLCGAILAVSSFVSRMSKRSALDDAREPVVPKSLGASTDVPTDPVEGPVVRTDMEEGDRIERALRTYDGYRRESEKLKGRFAETEFFYREMQNKEVRWTGYVLNVSIREDGDVSFSMSVPPETWLCFAARFGAHERERLLALRRGELVEVEGTLADVSIVPRIAGRKIEIIAP
jgi:hypothetical protein